MSPSELEALRAKLLHLKAELESLEESSNEAARPVELDQSRVGRLSRMDAMQMQQMARETNRRRRLQLTRVNGALQRIERDDYGYCVVCGEEIDIRRLSVEPSATHCTGCAR